MGGKRKYTDEQLDYLKSLHVPGRTIKTIADMFNAKYGTNLLPEGVRGIKKRYKIKVGRFRPPNALFTIEQEEWIKENIKGKLARDFVKEIQEKFGVAVTYSQLDRYKKNRRLTSGVDTRFEKGHVPLNKGVKLSPEAYAKAAPTMFKKGQAAHNIVPVGTEVVRWDGYIAVKVANPNKWKMKHYIVWEAVNGPVPEKKALMFLDGNKNNCTIENLALVSRRELLDLAQQNLRSENPEATKAGIKVVKLMGKLRELKKKGGKKDG